MAIKNEILDELLKDKETKRREVRGTNRERRALLVATHRMSAR